MKLTATQEKYLRAIYELSLTEEGARVSRIAAFTGVSNASASVAIGWLERNGLATRQAQRKVELTKHGKHQAVLSYGKQEIIQQFLTSVLKVPECEATLDVQRLEPVVSLDTLCAFCRCTRQAENEDACQGECLVHGLDDTEDGVSGKKM